MVSWSRKRRFIYAAFVTVILLAAVVIPVFLVIYESPTCFDSIQNGREQGVDCGGACSRLCASAFIPPNVSWTRFEEVAPGLYNIAAYIINPNSEGTASQVPYHMMVYDARGILIIEHRGKVDLPPQRATLAFARQVDMGKRTPAKVLFEFIGLPDWRSQSDPLSFLVIGEKNYVEDQSGSSLTVDLKNRSVSPSGPISVYAVLYDAAGNAIGFSKTQIDDIAAGESVIAPFTWPFNRNGKVVSIEVLPVAE